MDWVDGEAGSKPGVNAVVNPLQPLLTDGLTHEYIHLMKLLNEEQPSDHVYGAAFGRKAGNFQDAFGTVAPTDLRYSAETHGPNWSGLPLR